MFLLFHTVREVLKARIPRLFAIPSPVDHVLSEVSTKIRPSWVALHGMTHSLIELDKAVVHVSNWLVSLIVVFILSAL